MKRLRPLEPSSPPKVQSPAAVIVSRTVPLLSAQSSAVSMSPIWGSIPESSSNASEASTSPASPASAAGASVTSAGLMVGLIVGLGVGSPCLIASAGPLAPPRWFVTA